MERGYRVLRFWNSVVFENCYGVLESILAALRHDPVKGPEYPPPKPAEPVSTPPQGGNDWTVEQAKAYLDRMDPDVADLFPDRFVESELGEIPDGWEVKAFGELLEDVIGGDWGKEFPDSTNTEGIFIIRGTDLPHLRNGGIGAVPFRYTTEKKAKRRMLQDGDIVIEVSGGSLTQPTGRSFFITQDILDRFPIEVVCASFCRRFRPNGWIEGLLGSQHLDYLNSVGKMWEYQLQSTGISNFQTKRFLEEELIVWPIDCIAAEFSKLVTPIVRFITRNDSKTLREKRDALLPKLVSGEVDVGVIQRVL